MNCDEIMEIYIKSLRSDLSPEESSLLNDHLSVCGECRQTIRWDSAIVSELLKDKQTIPAENFTAEVCRQIYNTKLSFKHQLYEIITSSLNVIMPCFILTVFLIAFNAEIQNVLLLKIPNYYDRMILNIHSYFDALLEYKIYKEISIVDFKNFSWLIWIGFAGIIYSFVLMFSFTDKRG